MYPFFIVEREFLMGESVSGHGISNPSIFIRELVFKFHMDGFLGITGLSGYLCSDA